MIRTISVAESPLHTNTPPIRSRDKIAIKLKLPSISRAHFDALEEDTEFVRIERTHRLARASSARRLLATEAARVPRVDRSLVRAIVQARRWQTMLTNGEAESTQDIATREQVCPIYTGQLTPLAYLAPDLIEAILDGRQPERLSLVGLIRSTPVESADPELESDPTESDTYDCMVVAGGLEPPTLGL